MSPYPYPEGNALLIRTLKLQPHPEAGFYRETARTAETVPSPFADNVERNLATQIYYLLTPESPQGKMHMNKSITYHLLHQGRAKYTLIRPGSSPSSPPEIKHVVIGSDSSKGEVRQLVVEGGWWKASEIPDEDLRGDDQDKIGCLISEVVVPGFDFADHKFLDKQGLVELFNGNETSEQVRELLKYTQEK